VAGAERKGKGKKPAREAREHEGSSLLLSSQFSRGRFDPFPPFYGLPTQAKIELN